LRRKQNTHTGCHGAGHQAGNLHTAPSSSRRVLLHSPDPESRDTGRQGGLARVCACGVVRAVEHVARSFKSAPERSRSSLRKYGAGLGRGAGAQEAGPSGALGRERRVLRLPLSEGRSSSTSDRRARLTRRRPLGLATSLLYGCGAPPYRHCRSRSTTTGPCTSRFAMPGFAMAALMHTVAASARAPKRTRAAAVASCM